MRARIIILLVLSWARAHAQPAGEQLITTFGLGELRAIVPALERLDTSEPLDETRYAAVIELRVRHPITARLAALDDTQLAWVAEALCKDPVRCARALRCLADRCGVVLPAAPVITEPSRTEECRPRRRPRAPLFGAGFDVGSGVQRSGAANDGAVGALGISARLRLSERYGLVARVDRTSGRDEATDSDGDGVDDFESSPVSRFTALAGPSIVLDSTGFEGNTRSVRLDLLGGYLATRTLPGEDGLAVGADLALQLSVFRTGVRIVQGLGAASHATTLVVHLGVIAGATPTRTEEGACPSRERRSSGLALGFELPLTGGGFSSQLGYLAPGFGLQLLWHLMPRLDALVQADLLTFPRRDKDRVTHQAVLVGVRLDHGGRRRRAKTGWSSMLLAGVTHGAELEPSTVDDGPIADASIGWGGQDAEFAAGFRLHARFGLAPANRDYRVAFVSLGWELRFDRRRWRDRSRAW